MLDLGRRLTAPGRPTARRISWFGVAVAVLLVAAAATRFGYVAATPDYRIVHDARDYDIHAASIAAGHGFSKTLTGKPTAFRPPGYAYQLGAVYAVAGVADAPAHDRILAARLSQAVISTLAVVLIGILAAQLWGRTTGVVAMGLAVVYVPLVLVGGSMMSEPLFVVLMLAALAVAVHQRRSPHRYRYAVTAGLIAGLAVLTRANGLILLLPLVLAVWTGTPRWSRRALGPPAALVAVALLTVTPWTIRNAVELHAFIPVTTQLGSSLGGTYNDDARDDRVNPASWRSLRRVAEYQPLLGPYRTTSEPVIEQRLRHAALQFIEKHPGYAAKVAYWNTRRMLDVASWSWSRHTGSTISVDPGWMDVGVVCFWIFGIAALAGAMTRAARRTPLFVWATPAVMFASVVLLAVETPRYRAPLDPFVVMLAALAVTTAARMVRARHGSAQRAKSATNGRLAV